ncbi:hypothetical protein PanWU01x14_295380 [Parasponia andersonii]|uniref:Transmembrane protein n=1 Tax=Parasponia andersonii TaxID=3476 RepID=A0A2P5AVP7_PARAD|nr:hypothetical protein PanWU01x14_295380 [Parasponia andersonii]
MLMLLKLLLLMVVVLVMVMVGHFFGRPHQHLLHLLGYHQWLLLRKTQMLLLLLLLMMLLLPEQKLMAWITKRNGFWDLRVWVYNARIVALRLGLKQVLF